MNKLFEQLQKEITWWLTIILLIISLTVYVTSIDKRVQANEDSIKDIKVFMKDHTEAQQHEAIQLGILNNNVTQIMGYFGLKPKETK